LSYDYDEDDVLADVPSATSHRLRRRDKRRKPRNTGRQRSAPRDAPTHGGTVVHYSQGHATVRLSNGRELSAEVPPDFRRRSCTLAVGDDVVVAELGESLSRVVRMGPRRSTLSRLNPHHRNFEQVVVANVDVVAVVSAAVDPPLRPRLLDRYVVAILQGGARPLVVVNKLDQADDERRAELQALLTPWQELASPCLVSASSGEGLDELVDALAGCRVAFVGHSGVGKSSLANALSDHLGGSLHAAAGGLAAHGRGRHTTTSSSLHQLPRGIELIDTPGVRQFAPLPVSQAALERAFPGIERLAGGCAYPGCSHVAEPGCAVVAAVEREELDAARLDSFQRLRRPTGGLR